MVLVSGYPIGSQEAGKRPLPPKAEFEWWYQFYFATERGQQAYDKYHHTSPSSSGGWPRQSGTSMTLPSIAAREPRPRRCRLSTTTAGGRHCRRRAEYDDLEKRLAASPVITVSTITMEGDANDAPHPDPSAYATKFSGRYEHQTIKGGIGHNLPQEALQAFAEASSRSPKSRSGFSLGLRCVNSISISLLSS